MSTEITVNAIGDRALLQRARREQEALRQSNQEVSIDVAAQRALKPVVEEVLDRQAEQQQSQKLPKFSPQRLSARRFEEGGMGGWLDVSYVQKPIEGAFDQLYSWLSDDCFQISVGSGDGRRWETAIIRPGFGQKFAPSPQTPLGSGTTFNCLFAGARVLASFPGAFGTVPYFTSLPPGAITTDIDPRGIQVDFTGAGMFPQTAEFELGVGYSSSYNSYAKAAYHVLPVDDKTAVVVVPTFQAYTRDLISQTAALGGSPPNQYVPNIENATMAFTGFEVISYPVPGLFNTIFFKYPDEETNGIDAWMRINGYWAIYRPGTTTFFAEDPLETPVTSIKTTSKHRETVAFLVSGTNVKRIPVPGALDAKLRQRYPDMVYSPGGLFSSYVAAPLPGPIAESAIVDTWQQATMASHAGASSEVRTIFGLCVNKGLSPIDWEPNALLFGSPASHLYFDQDLNDYYFYEYNFNILAPDIDKVVTLASPYDGQPLFAPDHTTQNTAFGYMAALGETRRTRGPASLSTTALKVFTDALGSFKWPYLKEQQRLDVYEKFEADETGTFDFFATPLASNPRFDFSVYKNTINPSGNNTDVILNRDAWLTGDKNNWVSTGFLGLGLAKFFMENSGWTPHPEFIELSPARVLPPSIFLDAPDADGHPYLGGKYNGAQYLSMIAWIANGKDWRSKLSGLGFNASSLSL